VLAAAAIPSFKSYQLRSKRSEAYSNLAAIATTENALLASNSAYTGALSEPGPAPGPNQRAWTPAAEIAYGPLGWKPEGSVYFDYDVNVPGGPSLAPCPAGCVDCFTASAYGDLDGNALLSNVMYVKADAAGVSCPASLTGLAAPLDAMGNPIFGAPAVNSLADAY
jgi:type IV pilus assembly protein PilA